MANFGRLRLVSPAKLIFLLAFLWCERCDRVETAESVPLSPFASRAKRDNNMMVNTKLDPETKTETILSLLGGMACNGRAECKGADYRLGFCVGRELMLPSSTGRLQGLRRRVSTPLCGQRAKASTDFPRLQGRGREGRGNERSQSSGAQSTISSLREFSFSRKRARGFGSRLLEQPVTSSNVIETNQPSRKTAKGADSPSALGALVTPGVARGFFESSDDEEVVDEATEMEQLSAALERGEAQVIDQWASFELEQRRLSLGVAGARKRLLQELRGELEMEVVEEEDVDDDEDDDEEEENFVLRPPDQWRVNPGFVAEEEREGGAGGAGVEGEEEMQEMYVLSNPAHIRALSRHELAREGVVARGQRVQALEAAQDCKRVERREGESILAVARFEGLLLAAGTDEVAVWDVTAGLERVGSLGGHSGWVNCITVDSERRRLFSGADDGKVRVWDLDSLQCTGELASEAAPVLAVAVSKDGRELYVGGEGLEVWDLERMELKRRLKHTLDELCTKDRVRMRQLASFDTSSVRNKGKFSSISMAASRRVGSRRVGAIGVVGEHILSGMQDGSVWIWDKASYHVARCLLDAPRHSKAHAGPLAAVGAAVVHGSIDGALRVYDAASFALLHTLKAHRGPVLSVTVSQDGAKLVTCGSDGAALEWEVATLTVTRILQGHQGGVAGASEGAGSDFITACIDGSMRVW